MPSYRELDVAPTGIKLDIPSLYRKVLSAFNRHAALCLAGRVCKIRSSAPHSHDTRVHVAFSSVHPLLTTLQIVTRRRGGYCFELNTLFAALLSGLGYTVRTGAARVVLDGMHLESRWDKYSQTSAAQKLYLMTTHDHMVLFVSGELPCQLGRWVQLGL